MISIAPISAHEAEVAALITRHLAGMHAHSPPDAVFAVDLAGYADPALTLWGACIDGRLAGMVALRRLDGALGEIKSMRTHPDFLRRGVAQALLDHLIEEARNMGVTRLALETGSGPAFDPALTLYRRRGFTDAEAFGDYKKSAFNQFLELNLI
ncbi:GNAT family N-acetyltransferase [Sphingobium sp. CR28]|uniref:GNAT family N-acetyltransferase n=1 Tax=Sphingobium sp. CR28 TaxID=3400272 RepID=UPI003FED57FC